MLFHTRTHRCADTDPILQEYSALTRVLTVPVMTLLLSLRCLWEWDGGCIRIALDHEGACSHQQEGP